VELLRTHRSLVTADPAAGTVTKAVLGADRAHRRLFLDELRINRLLVDERPPLSAAEAAALRRVDPGPFVFAHGDVTPRNVMRSPDGPVLIDWEWAGRYPRQYELAFLWFVLVDAPGARAHIEQRWVNDRAAFVFCALLVQLRHLQMWRDYRPDWPVLPSHPITRDALVAELLDRP